MRTIFKNTEQALNILATGLIFAIKKAMPEAEGKLRRSVNYKLKQKAPNYTITIKYLKYGDYVDTGTRPHWMPIAAIKKWAKKKGLNPWAVQASIAKKGTKPHPWKHIIEPYVDNNMGMISKAYSQDLRIIISDALNKIN